MSLVRIEDASEPVELKVSEGEVAALVGYTREYAATLPQHYPQSHREMQAALAGVIRHMQYQRCEFCGSMDLYSFIQISCYNIPLSGTCRVCFYRPLQELYIMRNHLHL
ncbi:hypothetical protein KTH_04180 [Thermosporothrix hazakensis]|jgi:hypothetical protein|nr:hypothetical protein KTC_07750 [Thermosporothrix sp. COM3]GCE45549.1 hypothetical protein KTH_04180 [Thermosporothrix hazakensis]